MKLDPSKHRCPSFYINRNPVATQIGGPANVGKEPSAIFHKSRNRRRVKLSLPDNRLQRVACKVLFHKSMKEPLFSDCLTSAKLVLSVGQSSIYVDTALCRNKGQKSQRSDNFTETMYLHLLLAAEAAL